MIDYDSLYYPKSVKNIDKTSIQYAIYNQSLRRLWHKLFDNCPKLYSLFATNSNEYFEKIQNFNVESGGNNNYLFFISAIKWININLDIKNNAKRDAIYLELITASVVDWIIFDKTENEEIYMINGFSKTGEGVLGKKKTRIYEDIDIREIEVDVFSQKNSIYLLVKSNKEDINFDNFNKYTI